MKKPELDFAAFHKLHQAGDLSAAKEGYLAILKKQPNHIDALHWLAILYAQEEKYDIAVKSMQMAIQQHPENPNLKLHLANILKMQGLYTQAAEVLVQLLQTKPDYLPALNNLGTIYYQQENYDQAIQCYRRTIELQSNYIDAYYNLGLALLKQNKLEEASETYRSLLKHAPEHFAARFHLACILMQTNQTTAAIENFLIIEETHPHHFETQTNLATSYLKQGNLTAARNHYFKALELMPNDTQILFNLGVINTQQGHIDNAIQHYQRVVQINPDHFAAHNNLGVAFLAKQHVGFALQHFQEALRLQPTNKAIQYAIEMLSQNQRLLAAPPDYITSLFDAYADHYDSHLLKALDYQIPEIFHQAMTSLIRTNHKLDILDLGCGTGLSAVPFKPLAKTLIGVDLSEKMLAMAQQKNIYDQLIQVDLLDFLKQHSAEYDLILAGDVLVYIGDLEPIFAGVYQALRPKGLWIFNAEINEKKQFAMNQSGRFSHHQSYLDELAAKYNFSVLSYKIVVTRLQNNEPVYGHLYLLEKMKEGNSV